MSRQLNSMYCDDIRLEIGNKFSMMGIYNTEMVVPGFPFDLPRLFVSLKASTSNDDEFKVLKFIVMHDDQVIHEIEIDQSVLTQTSPELPSFKHVTGLQGIQTYQTFVELQGIRFEHPGIIRTRIVTERETVPGDGLMIIQAPSL